MRVSPEGPERYGLPEDENADFLGLFRIERLGSLGRRKETIAIYRNKQTGNLHFVDPKYMKEMRRGKSA